MLLKFWNWIKICAMGFGLIYISIIGGIILSCVIYKIYTWIKRMVGKDD